MLLVAGNGGAVLGALAVLHAGVGRVGAHAFAVGNGGAVDGAATGNSGAVDGAATGNNAPGQSSGPALRVTACDGVCPQVGRGNVARADKEASGSGVQSMADPGSEVRGSAVVGNVAPGNGADGSIELKFVLCSVGNSGCSRGVAFMAPKGSR